MYQVNFSDQSIKIFNELNIEEQMQLIEQLTHVNPSSNSSLSEEIGSLRRDNKTFYRLRANNLRVYFEINSKEDTLFCHYILPQHTLTDFIFRFKLPLSEEQIVEQHDSFWKYLESLKN